MGRTRLCRTSREPSEWMEAPWFTGAQWWLGAEMNELGKEIVDWAYFAGRDPERTRNWILPAMSEIWTQAKVWTVIILFSGTEFRRVVEKPLSRPRRKNRKYPNRKIQILYFSHNFWLCEKNPSFDFIPLSFTLLPARDFDWLVLVLKNPPHPWRLWICELPGWAGEKY